MSTDFHKRVYNPDDIERGRCVIVLAFEGLNVREYTIAIKIYAHVHVRDCGFIYLRNDNKMLRHSS